MRKRRVLLDQAQEIEPVLLEMIDEKCTYWPMNSIVGTDKDFDISMLPRRSTAPHDIRPSLYTAAHDEDILHRVVASS